MKRSSPLAFLALTGLLLTACGGPETPQTGDTTKPTVSLTASPSIVQPGSTVTLTATAADNVDVFKVSFYQGTTLIDEDTTVPYTATTTVGSAASGSLTYRAVASDAAGNTAEATATVSVNQVTSTVGTGNATVPGYLANSQGGAVVPGSAITVQGPGGTQFGVTDAKGQFTLKLDPGTYSIEFKKAGYAASRIEGLKVVAGPNETLQTIQKNAFATTLPTTAPTLNIKQMMGADATDFDPAKPAKFDASTGVPVQVTNTATDAQNSPAFTYVGVGGVPGAGFFGARGFATNDPKNTSFTTTVTLAASTLRGVRGPTQLYVVAYDTNENRTEVRLPIVITDDKPNDTPLASVRDAKARAVTISQKVGFSSPIRPTGAPTELSTLWVDVNWKAPTGVLPSPLGTRIWKSDDNKTFTVYKTVDGTASTARDGSASLEVGKPVYYQIEVFNSTQSVRSGVLQTTPLDSFTLTNIKPSENSTGVSRTPTVTWDVSKKVGDVRNFYVMVNDYPQQSANCFWGDLLCSGEATDNMFTDDGKTPALNNTGNTYSLAFNANKTALLPALESNHAYTLDFSAAAFSASGDAVSIAQDYYKVFYDLDLCNFGGPVCEGQVSNFITGDK